MNCEQVTSAASEFIERRLRLRESLMVFVHVAMCKGCGTYLEQFRLALLGLHSLPQPAMAPPSEQLLGRFREQARG